MLRSRWFTFALLAIIMGLAFASRSWAQSAEPKEEPKKGRFSIELGISSNGLTLKFGAGVVMPEPAPVLDSVCPNVVSAYLQTLTNRVKKAFAQTSDVSGAPLELERDKQVSQLFEVGEIYRRTGRYASARTYYQRAHLVSPTSRLGRLAIDRIGEIEDRLRDAEESSEVDAESLFHEMRGRTIPLGLAEPITY